MPRRVPRKWWSGRRPSDKNGFVTAPSGDEVVIKANDATVKDFTVDAGRVRAE